MNISIICAMDLCKVIGFDNKIPWFLEQDIQYFKYITLGKAIIMGRLTYESIGKHLIHRKNIVLTNNKYFFAKNCFIANSSENAVKKIFPYKDCMIIGGSKIYKHFHPYSNYLYITEINSKFIGNVFFPIIDLKEWILIKTIFREKFVYKIYKRKLYI